MSTLQDKITSELTASMKARDTERSSTLRMVKAALMNAEVAGKQHHELSDDDVVSVLATEAKKRREAAAAYDDGDRPDQAARERAEADVIAEFLPEQMSDADIRQLVSDTIDELGVRDDGMRAMGRVMGAVQPRTKGRADGAAVSAEVKRQLA